MMGFHERDMDNKPTVIGVRSFVVLLWSFFVLLLGMFLVELFEGFRGPFEIRLLWLSRQLPPNLSKIGTDFSDAHCWEVLLDTLSLFIGEQDKGTSGSFQLLDFWFIGVLSSFLLFLFSLGIIFRRLWCFGLFMRLYLWLWFKMLCQHLVDIAQSFLEFQSDFMNLDNNEGTISISEGIPLINF